MDFKVIEKMGIGNLPCFKVPSELLKLTSAKQPQNDAFSGIKKKDFNQYYVVAFDPNKIYTH